MSRQSPYRLSEEIRNYIVNKKKKNMPPNVIKTNILNTFKDVSYSTIRNVWARYQKNGNIEYAQPPRRPKSLTEREERNLVRSFVTTPGLSVRYVASHQGQEPIAQKPVCRQTIRNYIRRRQLKPRTSNRGAEVRQENKVLRLNFAKTHVNWRREAWARLVFSDECTLFPQRTTTRVVWSNIQAPRSIPFDSTLENKSINGWGYVRYDGVVRLFRFEGTMRETEYLNLLRQTLDEAVTPTRRREERLIFVQDRATYHTAGNVQRWLRQNYPNYLN